MGYTPRSSCRWQSQESCYSIPRTPQCPRHDTHVGSENALIISRADSVRGIVVSMVGVWLVVGSAFMAWRLPAKDQPELVDVKTEITNSLWRSRYSTHAFAALTTPSSPFGVCAMWRPTTIYRFSEGCGAGSKGQILIRGGRGISRAFHCWAGGVVWHMWH